MQQYIEFLKKILLNGCECKDRTGVGVIRVFGEQLRFDISEFFPLLTTKRMFFKGIVHELLWFLRGEVDINYLRENNVNIWNQWANEDGNLGPIYGKQWRAWETMSGQKIDQISNVIEDIKRHPYSRRLVVSAWNVADIEKMALPPCHMIYQFFVDQKKLSCMITQRAGDAFIGVPFNIASYALLTYLVAHQCDLEPAELIWSCGDCHIYLNHIEQVNVQITRVPLAPPKIAIKRKPHSIFAYEYDDISLVDYECHPKIYAEVAV